MATLDHIGLNRYIYMTASVDDMTLGSHNMDDIKNIHAASIIGSSLDDSRLLVGMNLYHNGPYGYSSWQQTRMAENPLHRHLRKNNQMPVVLPGITRVSFVNGERRLLKDRHGKQRVFDEPAVVSSNKPIMLVGTVDEYSDKGNFFGNLFLKKISLNNETSYFSNNIVNRVLGIKQDRVDETYEVLKKYYLEDGINSPDSPMSSFEKLVFQQTIYPPQQYTYKSYVRSRENFSFNWNTDEDVLQVKIFNQHPGLNDRFYDTVNFIEYHGLAGQNVSQWPLNVMPGWQTREMPLIKYHGFYSYPQTDETALNVLSTIQRNNYGFGRLWSPNQQAAQALGIIQNGTGKTNPIITFLSITFFQRPGCLYSRLHTTPTKQGAIKPSITKKTGNFNDGELFGGEAFWDVPRQSGKYPFYNTYEEFSEEIRVVGKDYIIPPEYKMSLHVADYFASGSFHKPEDIFDIDGGKADASDSASTKFFEIYSNSDFLQNFDVVLEDHKDYTDPVSLIITCKAIKKFIPYNDFYPAQRATTLSQKFFFSAKDHVSITYRRPPETPFVDPLDSANEFTEYRDENRGGVSMMNIMQPLFAPGVLFNTIKSGVACDYPLITGELHTRPDSENNGHFIENINFDKRIPFEALIEPEKYLADYDIISNEPHPSSSVSASVFWDGQINPMYSRMANNFLAEIPHFFLKDQQLTTIASSPQGDPNFGQVSLTSFGNQQPEVYSMRVRMFQTMESPNSFVTTAEPGVSRIPYLPPQNLIDPSPAGEGAVNDSITRDPTQLMYSRPSAFGPPSMGLSMVLSGKYPDRHTSASSGLFVGGSEKGFNFPYTPPYYHGQAWADISFRPTQSKKYTVSEILAASTVKYYRFDHDCWSTSVTLGTGPQNLFKVNDNAMQLNSSVNLFAKGKLGEINEQNQSLQNIDISVDDQTRSRWIIQPKFETPILNFIDTAAFRDRTMPTHGKDMTPYGMWHTYGRIPTSDEGVFMQVTDVPKNWIEGRLLSNPDVTGSLAELCGFSQEPVRLGGVGERKKISECVVAIPFVETSGVKEFFRLSQRAVLDAVEGKETADRTLLSLVDKMKRFIFPPVFDFTNFFEQVDPIAMYVFEFSSFLTQQDLADIWQNVSPEISREHEEARSTISHSLLGTDKLINKEKLREDVRWMVFKVKQRAASRYYDQVYKKKGDKLRTLLTNVTADASGNRDKFQYNWPYDFFSLVELVKIDASVVFSDVETDDDGNQVTKPKVAREENRRVQLNTLFPKGKK